MSFYKRSFLLFLISICLMLQSISSQVVCSLDELIKEIEEDIIDNGKLDCLRKSMNPLAEKESNEQRKRRIAAEWNSDCSFEAENTGNANWLVHLTNNYGLTNGLVDVNGKKVDTDFDDQADMCEIVRALIFNGKFSMLSQSLDNIELKVLDYIDCPGSIDQTKVCAATGGSFANKKGWLILLTGTSMTIKSEPKYEITNK